MTTPPTPDAAPIKSGDRIDTGVYPSRRRLTLEEASAGGLPAPWTSTEKQQAWQAAENYEQKLLYAKLKILYTTQYIRG